MAGGREWIPEKTTGRATRKPPSARNGETEKRRFYDARGFVRIFFRRHYQSSDDFRGSGRVRPGGLIPLAAGVFSRGRPFVAVH